MYQSKRKRGAALRAVFGAALALSIAAAFLAGCASGKDAAPSRGAKAGERPSPASQAALWKEAKGSALIIMDMQQGSMPIARQGQVFSNVQRLIEAADAAGAPVVWVYNDDQDTREGTPAFAIAAPLSPAATHLRVVKTSPSAFSGTGLGAMLGERGIGRLVFCGLASNHCFRASVEASYSAGYFTVVAEDAHSFPLNAGSESIVDAINEDWKKGGRIELLPSASIKLSIPAAARYGLGEADWPLSPAFAAFLDGSYRTLLARSPEAATQYGLSAWAGLDDTLLDGLSLPYQEETRRLEREALKALDAYDRSTMTPGDALSADAYRCYLADAVVLQEYADMDYLVNPTVFGVAYQMESLFTELHPVSTAAEARAYLKRLSALGPKIRDAAEALKRRAVKKAMAPRAVLESALPDIQAIARSSPENTPFYAAFAEKLAAAAWLEPEEREALLAEARRFVEESIRPAYGLLAEELIGQAGKAPAELGLWAMPGGDKYYAALLRAKTTTKLSPNEIHEMGLRELKRIHEEIVATAARSGAVQGTTAQAIVANAFSPSNALGPEQALRAYTERLRALEAFLPRYFPLFPSAPVELRTAPMGGYYQPGPIDGSRPGAFYVAAGSGANKAGMPTLLHHETLPGHHLQQAIAHELDLPIARKLLFFEAYVEGWALYAERLMAELGAYEDDPLGDIGRLQAEAFRAARLVVDTGIHAKKWSYGEAVDFMVDQGLLSRRAAQSEVIRYASLPGQATSYYIGFQRILGLREKARAALGDYFDLGAFHRTILACGALPFDSLSFVVDRYIAEASEGL